MVATTTTMLALAFAQPDSERASEIRNKISSMLIDLNLNESPFDEVVNLLREFSGISIFVDPSAYEKGGKDSMKVTLKVKGVRLITALKLVLGPFDLAATVKESILEISSKDKLQANVTTRMYDVRDMLVKINHFPGPRLELIAPTGAQGNGSRIGVEFSPVDDPVGVLGNTETLVDLIREVCDPRSWDNQNTAIAYTPGNMLMVTNTAAAHREIEKLLGLIR